jgi:hypothetical protein
LCRQHEAQFVKKSPRVFFRVEVAALPAPIGPGAGQTVEHLLGTHLANNALLLRQAFERCLIGNRTPQPGGNAGLLNPLQAGRNASLAEILLRQNISGHLAPRRGDLDVFQTENNRPVRVLDFAGGLAEFNLRIGILAGFRIFARDVHCCPSFILSFRCRERTKIRPRSLVHPCLTTQTLPEKSKFLRLLASDFGFLRLGEAALLSRPRPHGLDC